jgi:cytochrome c553
MKKTILFSLALLLLSGCSSEQRPEKSADTVTEHKTGSIKEAQKNVDSLNATIDGEINTETKAHTEVPNGATLYANKCASCHGKDGKKSALNNSAPIAGWEKERLITVLKGYKDGSYGGKMKAIMQGQSKPLSDQELELLSDYISSL